MARQLARARPGAGDTEAEEASGDITTYIYDYGDTFVDQEGGRHSYYANIRLGLQSLDHLQLELSSSTIPLMIGDITATV